MKAAVFHGPGQPLRIEDVATPRVGPTDALIDVAGCGVCHTDLHYLRGTPTFKKPPLILGHEAAGTVTEVGGAVGNVKPGDRVLIPAVLTCGMCVLCRRGRENICQNMVMLGNHIDGAYAEYVSVPAKDLLALPPDIPLEEGSIIADALSTPYHAVRNRGRVSPGETVAVFGCGGVGLNIVQLASASGARVFAIDIVESKLALARELGAGEVINAKAEDPVRKVRKLAEGGVEVAFEAIGSREAIRQAFDSVRAGGRLVVVGYCPEDVLLAAGRLMFREIEVLGSLGCRPVDYPPLIEMVRAGRIKLKPLISHRFRLDEINDAFRLLEEGKALRSLIIP